MVDFLSLFSAAGFIGLLFYVIHLRKRLAFAESVIYTTRASDVEASKFPQEIERLNLIVEQLDIAINGKEHPNEKQRYGGLNGFGGTTGQVQFLEGRLRHLITVLNEKLVVVGEKIGAPLLEPGKSLHSEVDAKQFERQ